MNKIPTLLISAALVLAAATPALAQTAPAAPPCSGPEYRQLDFWVGEWIAEWEQDGKKGTGTNRITKDEFGPCVIVERFKIDDGSFNGFSISTYRGGIKKWRQTWVDDQGGYFDFVGGPVADSDHVFALENKRPIDTLPQQRMIFQDVKADSFTWRWQRRAKAEDKWSDDWVIHYRRKPAAAK